MALADYKDKITKREALLRAKEREQTLKSKAQLEKLQAHINVRLMVVAPALLY